MKITYALLLFSGILAGITNLNAMDAPVVTSIENNSDKPVKINYDWKKDFEGDYFALGHSLREEQFLVGNVVNREYILGPGEKLRRAIEIFPKPHDYLTHLSISVEGSPKKYYLFYTWNPEREYATQKLVLTLSTDPFSAKGAVQKLEFAPHGKSPHVKVLINKDYSVVFKEV